MSIKTYEVDSLAVIVVDGALSPENVARIEAKLASERYPRSEVDGPATANVKTFALEIELALFRRSPLFEAIQRGIIEFFPDEQLVPYRSYCNLIVYGDMTYPHRDCDPESPDVTALYYANGRWEPSWAGETLFYDRGGDATLAISPRPGRLVLFRGAIEHRTGVPSRGCLESRLTVACKFKRAT